MRNKSAKNSTPNKINKPETLKNTRTKNNTEWIGFLDVTTNKPQTRDKIEKKKRERVAAQKVIAENELEKAKRIQEKEMEKKH